MKGLKCISKLSLFLSSVFLVLFCSVFLSKNASALTLTDSVTYSGNISGSSDGFIVGFKNSGDKTASSRNLNVSLSSSDSVQYIRTRLSHDFVKGHYYVVYIAVASNTSSTNVLSGDIRTYDTSLMLVDINTYNLSSDNNSCRRFLEYSQNNEHGYFCNTPSNQYSIGLELTFYARNNTSSVNFGIFGGSSYLFNFSNPSYDSNAINLDFYFSDIMHFIPKSSDSSTIKQIEQNQEDAKAKEEQQEQDLQDGQSDAEDGADSASAAAESGTDSLLGGLNTIFSALGSVSGSSCVLPNFSIYGLEFNNMDLCSFSVPPAITAITSVGMILGVGFLGYHLFHRIMNLYKELVG